MRRLAGARADRRGRSTPQRQASRLSSLTCSRRFEHSQASPTADGRGQARQEGRTACWSPTRGSSSAACARTPGARGSANRSRGALQRAGSRFANAERRLARLGSVGRPSGSLGAKSASSFQSPLKAPHLTVSGQTLQWNRVAGVNTYVLVRKVPGQVDHYSVITGTSITPPPVPGATVRYSVRTSVTGSEWAHEVSISYPPVAGQPSAPDSQAAPAITVSGQTLSWNEVAGVTTYVFVRKVPGQADQYSEVSGMSVTPAPVPGATVKYSVRTAVTGSAWAPEVAITYPSLQPPPPPPPVTKPVGGEGPVEGSSSMVVGLDIGGWAWASAVNDEAGAVKSVRSSYKHFNSDSQMELLAKPACG